jgi:hypothetical protein
MEAGLLSRVRRLAQEVELAKLVRNAGQSRRRAPDRSGPD